MTKPVRLQLSRKAGFDLRATSQQANGLEAVNVSRPGKWGNPWAIDGRGIPDAAEAVRRFRCAVAGVTIDGKFCPPIAHPQSRIGKIIAGLSELRGKNLACWCRLGTPCHADVLLELANR